MFRHLWAPIFPSILACSPAARGWAWIESHEEPGALWSHSLLSSLLYFSRTEISSGPDNRRLKQEERKREFPRRKLLFCLENSEVLEEFVAHRTSCAAAAL